MKPLIPCLALASVSLALPCVAQTSQPPTASPEAVQLLTNQIFREARGMHHRIITPQERTHQQAVLVRLNEADQAAAEALRNRDFNAAEGYFRESLEISPAYPAYYGLAEALTNQGRVAEAIEAYRAGICSHRDNKLPDTVPDPNDAAHKDRFDPNGCICHSGREAEAWMKYALLLSQTGQTAEAVIIYKKALSLGMDVDDQTGIRLPDAATLSPTAFQASAHVALGLRDAFAGASLVGYHERAMSEFETAWRLQPDLALTNYYYGAGWQKLSPDERSKYGTEEQARAALQKAAKLGEGDVKKNAEEALKAFAPPR